MSFWRSARRPVIASAITLALIAACPMWAFGAWQPNGIPVAPTGPSVAQYVFDLCTDGASGAYIVWNEETADDRGNVFLQRVTAEGEIAPGWPATGLRLGSDPRKEFARNLAPDMQGGAYVVWTTSSTSGLQYRL